MVIIIFPRLSSVATESATPSCLIGEIKFVVTRSEWGIDGGPRKRRSADYMGPGTELASNCFGIDSGGDAAARLLGSDEHDFVC
jgi:hypothetical protein